MIESLAATLKELEVASTAEEIADIIWLALHLPPLRRATIEQLEDEDSSGLLSAAGESLESEPSDAPAQPAGDGTKVEAPAEPAVEEEPGSKVYPSSAGRPGAPGRGGLPFRSPGVQALPGTLELSRGLRPLMRRKPSRSELVLDEEATAERVAEERVWSPVVRPTPTRWLEVAVMVDEGASMSIWRQTVAEFRRLLELQGAFRDVRTWRLDTEHGDEPVRLYASTRQTARSHRELIDPSGQRLIVIVTDCISPAWGGEHLPHVLSEWGRYHPVAVFQVLPQKLWSQTPLSSAVPQRVRAALPGAPNAQLIKEPDRVLRSQAPLSGTPVPFVTLEPQPVALWSRLVAGSAGAWAPAYILQTEETPRQAWSSDEETPEVVPPEERLRRFRAKASQTAFKLARLLAAAPLTLPVMRLVQRSMLPDSRQVHLAEVFLGGILRRIGEDGDDDGSETTRYDFLSGVRDLLLDSAPVPESIEVLKAVSKHLEDRLGQSLDFMAVLSSSKVPGSIPIDDRDREFAVIGAKVLRRLGGRYAAVVKELEQSGDNTTELEQRITSPVTTPQPLAAATRHKPPDPVPTSVTAEEKGTDADISPLPRAVLRPNQFHLLDGEWRFALDPEDRGLREKWYLGHEYNMTAVWPGSVESHMAAASRQQEIMQWEDKVVVWYEREFALPEREGGPPPNLLQLTFGACGYETRVWLNGRALRTIEGEKVHYGEYTSFSYELPEEGLRLFNRLTVRIADTMDAEIPRGKQQSHVYKRGGIWHATHTGGVRSVWLETVERNRLRARVGAASVVEDRLMRFDFTTLVHDPGVYTLRLKVYGRDARPDGAPIAEDDFTLRLTAGQRRHRVVLEVPGARLWAPQEPNLYRLVAQLIDEGGHAAQIETQFGLRKIEARGRYVYLNNEPVYLDGILYQPGTATYEEMRRHMVAMKWLGCNLVRVHIAGVDPRIYNLADQLGMMLWVEVPSPHSSSQRSRRNHRAELLRMLALIETHPSVVIWSLYNEDWGAQDIATNPETSEYVRHTYHYMQTEHQQFLVVDNDGWHHVSWEGRLMSDLLTAHLYTPDLGRWRELLDKLVRGELEGVTVNPLVVGDPFSYRGQVPLVVSQWGGFDSPRHGDSEEATSRAERIRLFKRELRGRPLAGDVYTQATDIEDERNGLIDPKTGELSVPPGLLDSTPPDSFLDEL